MDDATISQLLAARAQRWRELTPEQQIRRIQETCEELFIYARAYRKRRRRELQKERI